MDLFASTRGTSLLVTLLAGLLLVGGCSVAGAAPPSHQEAVAAYDAALKPLKHRSDILEERYAALRQAGHAGPAQVRQVLGELVPAYAALLAKARAIEVHDSGVKAAHEALLASLDAQQRGLRLALRALEQGDATMMARARASLERAERLLLEHRRLLKQARG